MEQESARSIIEKLVRIWKTILRNRNLGEGNFVQVERGAQLSKKNNDQKTPLDLMFDCIQSPGDFINSLWSKRVSPEFRIRVWQIKCCFIPVRWKW